MKTRLFISAILSITFIAILSSCNKVEDIPEQYMRGGNNLTLAPDGNLLIAGYNTSSTTGYDATLIKASATNGDTIWSKKFGSSYSDAFFSVANANKGGFIATGFSNQAAASNPKMFLVITDANGKLVKSGTYGGSGYSQGFCVVPNSNSDSGYLVAGYIKKSSQGDRDIYLVRIKNSGDVIWEKSIGAKGSDQFDTLNDIAYNVINAPDGGYFITGTMNGYSTGAGRIFLMKVSSKGDSLWTKTYSYGIGSSLCRTSDNKLAISGSIIEGNNQNIFLLKTDTIGKPVWDGTGIKTFGGSGYEYGSSMVQTSAGDFVMVGITNSQGAGSDDVFLLAASSSGDKKWDKTYGGDNVDQGYGIVLMPDNGFGITGLTNTGGSYIFLNRVNASGDQATNWPTYVKIK